MKIICLGHSNPTFGLLGIAFTTLGLLFGLYWNSIFEQLLQKLLSLRPDSLVYEFWKTTPAQINIDLYIFNWTNSDEFYDLSKKPRFEELGPYRFIEKSDKFDIDWHPENASVSYSKRSYYYFDAEASNGKLTDKIITLDIVSVGAATKINRWDFFHRKLATLALNMYMQSIAQETTVDKFFFEGHKNLVLDVGKTIPFLDKELWPFDKFGYCYPRNGSAEFCGRFNIHTGADDFSKIGTSHTWNYREQTGVYKSNCGIVSGSPGEIQQPNLKVNDSISYFVPDFCRSIPLDYVDQFEFKGINSFKFAGGQRVFDNGTLYPENKCFCAYDKCVPSGVMSIEPCWYDVPLFISHPHFYQADPIYLNAVDGLKPNKDLHELYVLLEPQTGLTLDIKARVQLNALVEPLSTFPLFNKVPRIFFPLLWLDENVTAPDEALSIFGFLPIIMIGGQILAAIMIVLGIIIVGCHLRAKFFKAANIVNFISEKKTQEKLYEDTSVECPLLNARLKPPIICEDLVNRGSGLSIASSTAVFIDKDANISIDESDLSLSGNGAEN